METLEDQCEFCEEYENTHGKKRDGTCYGCLFKNQEDNADDEGFF